MVSPLPPLPAALTFGLTDAEAACWLGADEFKANPALVPGALFEACLLVQRRLVIEFTRQARRMGCTTVRVQCRHRAVASFTVEGG